MPGILLHPSAQRALLPSIKATGLDRQTPPHPANAKLALILGNKGISHFVSLAKYAVAFLRNSRIRFRRHLMQDEAEGLGAALQISDHPAAIALLIL